MTLPITVIVPVKNEEQNLPGCLDSIRGVAHIVVVDSHSTDRTVEIATAANATVLQFAWDGGPIKKRNWVLETYDFKTPWVLFLDADERLTSELASELETVLFSTDHNGFWIRYSNFFMGRRLHFGDAMRKLPLLRAGCGKFETLSENRWTALDMEVHEHLLVDGSVGTLRNEIDHHDDRGVDSWFRRHVEYASWEAQRFTAGFASEGHLTRRQRIKYRWASSLLFPIGYFVYSYIIKLGFLDGLTGLRFAAAKSSYFVQVALKIAERRQKLK